jgi:YVTN family beta-propeller protein
MSDKNISAQTYDTIMKQREIFKNNPQIQLGQGAEGLTRGHRITANSITNKIYATNSESNTVSVIDDNRGNVTNNIRVGNNPVAIAADESTDKIYVVNKDSNTVSVIDGLTDKKLGDVAVESNPSVLAVDYLNHMIYVAGFSQTVSVIDESNDKVTKVITLPVPASDIKYYGGDIYIIPTFGDSIYDIPAYRCSSTSISNSTQCGISNTIAVGKSPVDMAGLLTEYHDMNFQSAIVTSNMNSKSVSIIIKDLIKGGREIIRTSNISLPTPLEFLPFHIVTSDKNKIYVEEMCSSLSIIKCDVPARITVINANTSSIEPSNIISRT